VEVNGEIENRWSYFDERDLKSGRKNDK